MERTAAFYHTLETEVSPLVAQYVLPFAYKVRFYVQLNAREAFHLLELRTASGGHPGYRRICQEMHRLIKEQAGHRLIADAMQYIDFNKYELTRLSGERQAAARRAAQGMSELRSAMKITADSVTASVPPIERVTKKGPFEVVAGYDQPWRHR